MTDTTDIAALRVEIAELRLKIAKGYDRFIPETQIHIKLLARILDQLEAERQRADNWSVNFENERFRADKLAAHIEALKGDQVPVAYVMCNHGVPDIDFVFADEDSAVGTTEHLNTPDSKDEWTVKPLFTAPQKPVVPEGLHPQTAKLVIEFATALAEKLHKAEQKYGYSDTWMRDHWQIKCLNDFNHHVSKGDPRDVAAYCAFMWYHGWPTAIQAAGGVVKDGA